MFSFQLVYVVAAYLCKVSVALVLLRISGTDRQSIIRKILLASIAIVTIFSIATFLALALQCRPVTLNWGIGKGECVAPHVITDIAYAFSAADIASNWLYAVSSNVANLCRHHMRLHDCDFHWIMADCSTYALDPADCDVVESPAQSACEALRHSAPRILFHVSLTFTDDKVILLTIR